jgi:hypothetical protein
VVDDQDEFVEHEVIGRDEFGALGNVILTGWALAGAVVTLTLRSGVQLTGLVWRQEPTDPPEVVRLVSEYVAGRQTVRHHVLMSEVAAITAVGRS